MYRAIRIPPEKGEEIREKAIAGKFLDITRKIRKLQTKEGAFLEIPVIEVACEAIEGFPVIEQENPNFWKFQHPQRMPKGSLSETELAQVPSGWHILGDIIIVSIPKTSKIRKF